MPLPKKSPHYKLRVRIAGHEFESAGNADVVSRNYDTFVRAVMQKEGPLTTGEVPIAMERTAVDAPEGA